MSPNSGELGWKKKLKCASRVKGSPVPNSLNWQKPVSQFISLPWGVKVNKPLTTFNMLINCGYSPKNALKALENNIPKKVSPPRVRTCRLARNPKNCLKNTKNIKK